MTCSLLYLEYEKLLLAALRMKTTVKKHYNVMLYMLGYFKKVLTAEKSRNCSKSWITTSVRWCPWKCP